MLQPADLLTPIPALLPLAFATQPMIKATISPMKKRIAKTLIVLAYDDCQLYASAATVGLIAILLRSAIMRAAIPNFLPSSLVEVEVAPDVVLAGVPGPDERTICMLPPLFGLLPAAPELDAAFSGAIAPVERTIPVVLAALTVLTALAGVFTTFKTTEDLDGC